MILIACAVAKELQFLAPRPHVEVLVTGVGPVEAAAAVSRALGMGPYDLVINAGLGGTLGGAPIGSGVVVSDDSFELDLETGIALALPDGAAVVDRVSSDLTLVDALVERGFPCERGVTVGRVTASEETAQRLARRGATVESMEGFAVLRASEIAGVPAIEVRGISNRAGERVRSGWDFSAGVAGLASVLDALLKVTAPADA